MDIKAGRNVLVIVCLSIVMLIILSACNSDQTDINTNNDISETPSQGNNTVLQLGENSFDNSQKVNNNGNVSVSIKWLGFDENNKKLLMFEVELNTHSVDLSNVSLDKMSVASNDAGVRVDSGMIWEEISDAGHHVSGYLKVPNEQNGRRLVDNSTKYIRIEIKGLAKVSSRVFEWDRNR